MILGMDKPREGLPPSPPMTDSSTKGSPPSHPENASPDVDSPPYSPGSLRHRHSSSPRHGSPLPPLPPEVFLTILRFLSPRDQLRARLVSKSWSAFVEAEPRFWDQATFVLERDDLNLLDLSLSRAVGNGNRKRGGLRSLVVRNNAGWDQRRARYCPLIPLQELVARSRAVLALAERATVRFDSAGRAMRSAANGRYSTLDRLVLDLRVNLNDTLHVMDDLARWSTTPVFADLKELDLSVAVPLLPLHDNALLLFPKLRSLAIQVPPHSNTMHRVPSSQWYFGCAADDSHLPTTLDYLQHLVIAGATLTAGLTLPDAVPRLTSICLSNVRWTGKALFLLLRRARRTLESLELSDLTFESSRDEAEDWALYVDVREPDLTDGHVFPTPAPGEDEAYFEDPAPIIFPRLRSLQLSAGTPPLFSSLADWDTSPEGEELPTPIFVMPALEYLNLDDIHLEPDGAVEDESLTPLPTLGRNAAAIERFVLSNCVVDDFNLLACFAAMSSRITVLDLSASTVSDQLLARLPRLTPNLRHLDVRVCPEVTCQGVARLVEVVRGLSDEGVFGIEKVFVDHPEYRDRNLLAYEWLDFVGILERDEDDFAGSGPKDPKARRIWVVEGKKDEMWKYKELLRRREHQEQLMKAEAARQLAAMSGHGGGGSGSSRAAQRGAAPTEPYTGANALHLGSHGITPFAPPPRHPNYATDFAQSTPINLPPMSPSVLPPMPTSVLPPMPTSVLPTMPPSVLPRMPPSVLAPVPSSKVPAQQLPSQLPSHLVSLPMVAGADDSVPPQHAARSPEKPVQTRESQLDLSSLDSMSDYSDLDPALLREQQLIMEQLERQRNAGLRPTTVEVHDQREAYFAAQRRAAQETADAEYARTLVEDSTRSAVAAALPSIAHAEVGLRGKPETEQGERSLFFPPPDDRLARLDQIRQGGATQAIERSAPGHFAIHPDEMEDDDVTEDDDDDELECVEHAAFGSDEAGRPAKPSARAPGEMLECGEGRERATRWTRR
ncbi:hypothetical protein JCM10212_004615 [Sporobolomyces blumeae]